LTRRDFLLVSDGRQWAHESNDWLLAAHSGVLLAHRTGNVYYSPDTGSPLYYEATEPVQADLEASPRPQHPRVVRAPSVTRCLNSIAKYGEQPSVQVRMVDAQLGDREGQ
jgi:hypothetical protein